MRELTQAELKDALDYDPETGIFTWLRPSKYKPELVGTRAGSQPKGRRGTSSGTLDLKGRKYSQATLAWLYMTGAWPTQRLTHVNGVSNDNRFANLRVERQSDQELTHADLLKSAHYDPITGVFTRKATGKPIASVMTNGYLCVCVNGQRYYAHRLAWFYAHGRWPKVGIDHANGVRTDNSLRNLREATNQQNAQNRGRPTNNTSGRKGVSWQARAQKWQAMIVTPSGKQWLGLHSDLESAAAAYREAALREFGEFACVEYEDKGTQQPCTK